jgi:hypothetical protein
MCFISALRVHCIALSPGKAAMQWSGEYVHAVLINPWRMREGYGSRSLCERVCCRATCYVPRL